MGISGQDIPHYISTLNIRIAHEVKGAAGRILPLLYLNGQVGNTLIVSPPGCGKTTLLRDMIRLVSDGNCYGEGVSVGVVDERSEIGGSYLGVPANDVGMRTDLLDGISKVKGMMMLLRSMSPRVVAGDELGGKEDVAALWSVMQCGAKVLATVHGTTLEEIRNKPFLGELIEKRIFERYILLNKKERVGNIEGVYDVSGALCYV